MSPGYYVSLGIEMDGDEPVHAFRCDHCEGTGLEPKPHFPWRRWGGETHDPEDEVRNCHACVGGSFSRYDCDCAECTPLRKAAETKRRAAEALEWEAEWERHESLQRWAEMDRD